MDIYSIKPNLKYQYIKYRRQKHYSNLLCFYHIFLSSQLFSLHVVRCLKKYHFKNCPHHKSYLIPSCFNVSNLELYKPFNRCSSDYSGFHLLKKEILIIYRMLYWFKIKLVREYLIFK